MSRRVLKIGSSGPARVPIEAPGLHLDRVRRSPECRRVVYDLRRLARPWGEPEARRVREVERVLLAVSGGADSAALALMLASVPTLRSRLVIAHITHDLRPARQANADARRVRELAERLSVAWAHSRVRAAAHVAAAGGNAEAVARRLRYAALARLARRNSCSAVVTAHHADDQLETMIMAMLRGAGPRGLAGIAERRLLSRSPGGAVVLIRPMLSLRRGDSERICEMAQWRWNVDATNADQTRLRSAVRAQVIPVLERLRPGAALRAVDAARVQASAARALTTIARSFPPRGGSWPRRQLAGLQTAVLGEVIRREARRRGLPLDAITHRAIMGLCRVARDGSTEPRTVTLGPLRIAVSADTVAIMDSARGPSRASHVRRGR